VTVVEFAKTKARKPILYSLVSAISLGVSQATLVACHGALDLTAVPANVIAVAVGSIPSYRLNRSWVWGRTGRSHLRREVAPFWMLSFLGLALSTGAVAVVERYDSSTVAVSIANLAAFGALWVGKFLLLHYVLFRDAPAADAEPIDVDVAIAA